MPETKMSFQGFWKGAEGSGQRVWDMKSHAEGWVPGFQCPKVSEERGAGSVQVRSWRALDLKMSC